MLSFGGSFWGLRGGEGFRTSIILGSSGGVVAVQTGYGYNYGSDYGSA